MGIRKYNNPIIGTIYGQWTIISTEIKNNGSNSRNTYYKVRCQCGKEGWRAAHTLISNTTKSCKSRLLMKGKCTHGRANAVQAG